MNFFKGSVEAQYNLDCTSFTDCGIGGEYLRVVGIIFIVK